MLKIVINSILRESKSGTVIKWWHEGQFGIRPSDDLIKNTAV